MKKILIEELDARSVLVGDNFRFGAGQAGDVALLRTLGEQMGFRTEIIHEVKRHGRTVSSSAIRHILEDGDVALANRLLEHAYSIEGEVVQGRGVGSKQTVPTLNLQTTAELIPATGVYITATTDIEAPGRSWNSITNIGFRPTFDDGQGLSIETFLLTPLTGDPPRRIRLQFLRRVREERKFESPEVLKAQILKDVSRAQAYFRRLRRWSGQQE